jgi:hypothetical protein
VIGFRTEQFRLLASSFDPIVDHATSGMREIIWRAGVVKKRKKKRFEAGKEARRRARASGLAPASTRVIPDKRKRPPKHRKDWIEAET